MFKPKPKPKMRPSMPPPEMPKPATKEPPAEPASRPNLAERLRAAAEDENETPAQEATETPFSEIAEKYGLSEEDGKAFMRDCMEAMMGKMRGPEPQGELPLEGEE